MKSVVICGSSRFKSEMVKFYKKLKELGVVVYEPHLHRGKDEWDSMSDSYKELVSSGLTFDHFYKIQMADVVFVFNQNGYSGNSVTLEIGYAVALGKPIYALSEDNEELCRHVLIREIIKTPRELVKRLK